MVKKNIYTKNRKNTRPELIGKKVRFTHQRHGIIRGMIVETDKDTYVMATDLDRTIRWRLTYPTLENGTVEYP